MKIWFSLFLCFVSMMTVGQSTLSTVPNPKDTDANGYVSNPNGILDPDNAGIINAICAEIEAQDSFQVAFVVLESIGSEEPKDFVGQLFNQWGIGHVGRDDGLLVLFVLDQRRIEFETGYGTESVLTDYQCVQIQQDYMLNYFRDGDYSQGLLEGAKAIQATLRGQVVDRFEVQSLMEREIIEQQAEEEARSHRIYTFVKALIVWHSIGLILFLIALLIARLKNDPYDKYNIIRFFGVWIWAILFPVTHIFVVLLAKSLKQRYRDMIRFSSKTDEIMRKLTDEDEDKYLTSGQITEELVKSVDYDVWVTDKSDDVLILAYRPLFTKYTTCPKCHFKTYFKVYDRQISAPSYSSSGTGERKYECANCKHVDRSTYVIPRLQRSNRTSGSTSWGGGGWSSGGGGFSGGGSFGGGRSGGGGGGSSW